MSEYLSRFKSCGKNVQVAPDVYIESPETIEVGDDVVFQRGFHMIGQPKVCRFGSKVKFYPNCFLQGSPDRLIIGDQTAFFPTTYISSGGKGCTVEIGHNSHFAPGCVLYGWGNLIMGNYCNIAAHVVFATVGHDYTVKDKPMSQATRAGPITLEDDIWIAANATICANTRIAKGCVIGAGAVVTRDTEPMGLYVGVPARRLRDR